MINNVKKSKCPLYTKYTGIKTRCYNPNNKDYPRYGGRGIKCDWNCYYDFEKDMLSSYKKGLTLDRIDVNGNYSKENCRWATRKIQQNNKRDNVIIEFNGQKKTLSEWSETLKVKRYVINNRLIRGWSIELLLTQPVRKYRD